MNSEIGRSEYALRLKKFRKDIRQQAVDYLGGCCKLCGYKAYVEAFDFHHIDPATKSFNISKATRMDWETLQPEVDKCVLLCANCHRETHAGLTVYSLAEDFKKG